MQKKYITALLVIFFLFGGWWLYTQLSLLGYLVNEKGENMHDQYYSYVRFFSQLEQLSAEILLSNTPLEEYNFRVYANYYFNDMRYRNLTGTFNRYGLVRGELRDRNLREFARLSDNYFNYLMAQQGHLSPEEREYIAKIHLKAKEINDILAQHTPHIRNLRGKKFFYSNVWVKAINEANDSFAEYPEREFAFSYRNNIRHEDTIAREDLERILGSSTLTPSEVGEKIQEFIGQGGKIKDHYVSQGAMNIYGVMWDTLGFETEEYYVDAFASGGKVLRLDHKDWRNRDHSASYKPAHTNITAEEAVANLIELLAKRGIAPLEVYGTRIIEGQYLNVDLLPLKENYLSKVSPVRAVLDLTNSGKVLSLDLFLYWLGSLYDASQVEEGLAGYQRARQRLQAEFEPKDEKLVGTYGTGFDLEFYWRFTVELYNEEYYVYISPQTGQVHVWSVARGW